MCTVAGVGGRNYLPSGKPLMDELGPRGLVLTAFCLCTTMPIRYKLPFKFKKTYIPHTVQTRMLSVCVKNKGRHHKYINK